MKTLFRSIALMTFSLLAVRSAYAQTYTRTATPDLTATSATPTRTITNTFTPSFTLTPSNTPTPTNTPTWAPAAYLADRYITLTSVSDSTTITSNPTITPGAGNFLALCQVSVEAALTSKHDIVLYQASTQLGVILQVDAAPVTFGSPAPWAPAAPRIFTVSNAALRWTTSVDAGSSDKIGVSYFVLNAQGQHVWPSVFAWLMRSGLFRFPDPWRETIGTEKG